MTVAMGEAVAHALSPLLVGLSLAGKSSLKPDFTGFAPMPIGKTQLCLTVRYLHA